VQAAKVDPLHPGWPPTCDVVQEAQGALQEQSENDRKGRVSKTPRLKGKCCRFVLAAPHTSTQPVTQPSYTSPTLTCSLHCSPSPTHALTLTAGLQASAHLSKLHMPVIDVDEVENEPPQIVYIKKEGEPAPRIPPNTADGLPSAPLLPSAAATALLGVAPEKDESSDEDDSSDDEDEDAQDELPLTQLAPLALPPPAASNPPAASKRTPSAAAKRQAAEALVLCAAEASATAKAFAEMEVPEPPTQGTRPAPALADPAGTKRQRKGTRKPAAANAPKPAAAAKARKPAAAAKAPTPVRTGKIRLEPGDDSVAVRTAPIDDEDHFVVIGKRADDTLLCLENGADVEVLEGPTNGFYMCRAGEVSGWVRVKKICVHRPGKAASAPPAEEVSAEQTDSDGEEEEEESDSEAYDVSRIEGERIVKGVRQYCVFWEGWPDDSATWEPASNLRNCAVFQQYLEERD
jgi:hypothetical protein